MDAQGDMTKQAVTDNPDPSPALRQDPEPSKSDGTNVSCAENDKRSESDVVAMDTSNQNDPPPVPQGTSGSTPVLTSDQNDASKLSKYLKTFAV